MCAAEETVAKLTLNFFSLIFKSIKFKQQINFESAFIKSFPKEIKDGKEEEKRTKNSIETKEIQISQQQPTRPRNGKTFFETKNFLIKPIDFKENVNEALKTSFFSVLLFFFIS